MDRSGQARRHHRAAPRSLQQWRFFWRAYYAVVIKNFAALSWLLAPWRRFSFLGAGGRLPKARRGRVYILQFIIIISLGVVFFCLLAHGAGRRRERGDDELLVRAPAVLKSQGPENRSRGRPGAGAKAKAVPQCSSCARARTLVERCGFLL